MLDCLHYYLRLCALLYYVVQAILVLALIYCNFLKESIRHICQIRTTKGPLGLKEAEEV